MNPIENWRVMVLEVMQRVNARTSSHFKTRLFLGRSNEHSHAGLQAHLCARILFLIMSTEESLLKEK